MKKELIQTRNRKMNKKMIVKHEELEEDWTNNEEWLKSYTVRREAVREEEVEILDQPNEDEEVVFEEEGEMVFEEEEDDGFLISGSPTVASPEVEEEQEETQS